MTRGQAAPCCTRGCLAGQQNPSYIPAPWWIVFQSDQPVITCHNGVTQCYGMICLQLANQLS